MTATPKPSFPRRWLLPLLAGICTAGATWWLMLPDVPRPILEVKHEGEVTFSTNGQALILKQPYQRHQDESDGAVEVDIVTGKRQPLAFQGPRIPEGHLLAGEGPGYFVTYKHGGITNLQAARLAPDGPFVIWDRASGKRRGELPSPARHRFHEVLASRLKLALVRAESWFCAGVRVQIYDPHTLQLERDWFWTHPHELTSSPRSFSPSDLRYLQVCVPQSSDKAGIYTDTLILDCERREVAAELPGLFTGGPLEEWSEDDAECFGCEADETTKELRAVAWNWRERRRKAGPYLHHVPQGTEVLRFPVARFPASDEWLLHVTGLRSQSKLYNMLPTWLPDFLKRMLEPKTDTEFIVTAGAAGPVRLVAALEAGIVLYVLSPSRDHLLLAVPNTDRWALYPLAGAYPWPLPWRFVAALVAGLVGWVLVRRLLRPRSSPVVSSA